MVIELEAFNANAQAAIAKFVVADGNGALSREALYN